MAAGGVAMTPHLSEPLSCIFLSIQGGIGLLGGLYTLLFIGPEWGPVMERGCLGREPKCEAVVLNQGPWYPGVL